MFPQDVVAKSAHNVLKQDSDLASSKALSSLYRSKVIDAYRNRRIFTVFGNYRTIRRSLLKRGWLEKLSPSRYAKLQNLPEEVLLQHAKQGNDYEAVAISKIIHHLPAFFVWQAKTQRDLYADVQPYRNRIRRAHSIDFSTKVGLIGCAEQEKWFRQECVSGMLHPRFFRLGINQEEQKAFIEEFRMTQCRSLIRFLCRHLNSSEDIVDHENGTVPPSIVHFALDRVKCHIDDLENEEAFDEIPEEDKWSDFLINSSRIINEHHKIKCTFRELTDFVKAGRSLLSAIENRRPDLKWDGCKNLWILKPGYQSRGVGIIIRNNLDDILHWSEDHSNRRYIVQKYIEQALLIYRTKFDIRAYMLMFIRESVVQIWIYKDCYLRFSSQEYNIDDLREVIHLTNNSVQKKYKNTTIRDHRLPKQNMWSLEQFKTYMKIQNLPEDMWENRVFSGFRENLIAVVLASLAETTLCENAFELYGCDFMLDEQFQPILIEINSTPDLSPSTDVTARICPMVMQDCIKVIVDFSQNSRASTGLFQLVHEVNYKFEQDFKAIEGLNVNGKTIKMQTPDRNSGRPKLAKKPKNIENTKNKLKQKVRHNEKTTPASVKLGKSKTSVSKTLKAATKEALALHYTMPK